MDPVGPDVTSWPAKLVLRMGRRFRSDKDYTNEVAAKRTMRENGKLRKRGIQRDVDLTRQAGVNELGEREYSIFSEASTLVGTPQTQDHTDLMHQLSLGADDAEDPRAVKRMTVFNPALTMEQLLEFEENYRMIESLPDDIWMYIASLLDASSAAFLAMTNRALYHKIGYETMWYLNRPEHRHQKIRFLHSFDRRLPDRLLCFHCAAHHRRILPGKEVLKADFVANPVFLCPRVKSSVFPRMRLTHGRELPYAFVQLALREHAYSPAHGISHTSLARHWKCKDSTWSHRTRYMIINGHLAVRIRSQSFAAPDLTETAGRHLLYDREEYMPFFSVCAHWRDGELMRVCKCALSHVPRPAKSLVQQLKEAPGVSRAATRTNFIITGCDLCRPARRCPDCPSEYLVEIQMAEDANDPINRFKHAVVVTRWMDLGDGSSPFTSPEWVAVKGQKAGDGTEDYDSFSRVGKRAIAGVFESAISGTVPGQRMISLNPKNEKRGEEGHGWY